MWLRAHTFWKKVFLNWQILKYAEYIFVEYSRNKLIIKMILFEQCLGETVKLSWLYINKQLASCSLHFLESVQLIYLVVSNDQETHLITITHYTATNHSKQ